MLRWRRDRTIRAAAGLALALLAAPAVPAMDLNGFLREKGKGDVSVSYTGESYDQFYMGSTKIDPPPGLGEVETKTISVWAAYGLTDRITLFGTLPYVDTEGDGTAGFAEKDLQDVTVLGAYRIASLGRSVHSEFVAGLGVRTPASDYEANLPVSVGDGTTDALLRFVYQLRKGRFYFSQQVGYDIRNKDAPDGLPLYTEVGYTFGRVTVNGAFSKLVADDGTDIGDPGFTFPGNREEYERGWVKAYIRLNPRFGLSVSAFTTFDGRNTGDSTGGSIGLNVSF
jgi:hypothetical protein